MRTLDLYSLYQNSSCVHVQIPLLILTCRLRAARVEDFPQALVELHRQFHCPFPATSPNTTPIVMTASFSYAHEMKQHPSAQKSKENSPALSGGEINRPNRPPDLDLSLTQGNIHTSCCRLALWDCSCMHLMDHH